MINTAKQLKDLIRNLSKKKSADAQILMRNYMMERFLERISISQYHDKFILNFIEILWIRRYWVKHYKQLLRKELQNDIWLKQKRYLWKCRRIWICRSCGLSVEEWLRQEIQAPLGACFDCKETNIEYH